jgi:hypothetical protein
MLIILILISLLLYNEKIIQQNFNPIQPSHQSTGNNPHIKRYNKPQQQTIRTPTHYQPTHPRNTLLTITYHHTQINIQPTNQLTQPVQPLRSRLPTSTYHQSINPRNIVPLTITKHVRQHPTRRRLHQHNQKTTHGHHQVQPQTQLQQDSRQSLTQTLENRKRLHDTLLHHHPSTTQPSTTRKQHQFLRRKNINITEEEEGRVR